MKPETITHLDKFCHTHTRKSQSCMVVSHLAGFIKVVYMGSVEANFIIEDGIIYEERKLKF